MRKNFMRVRNYVSNNSTGSKRGRNNREARRHASAIDHRRVMTSMRRVLRNDLAGSDGPRYRATCAMTHVEQLSINCPRLSNKGELLSQSRRRCTLPSSSSWRSRCSLRKAHGRRRGRLLNCIGYARSQIVVDR